MATPEPPVARELGGCRNDEGAWAAALRSPPLAAQCAEGCGRSSAMNCGIWLRTEKQAVGTPPGCVAVLRR